MAFLLTSILAKSNKYKEELLLVLEVSRHGARSSKKIYDFTVNPEDNFKNKSELTNVGRLQHHQLGGYIRTKYILEK